MRNLLFTISPLLLSGLLLLSCNSSSKTTNTSVSAQTQQRTVQTDTTYADGAKRITIADAQELIKKNQAYVIDVRNQASYDAGHIPGSKLIPAAEILNHVDELPKDKQIITYCS